MDAALDPERYARVKELFARAAGLSDEERGRYLAGACGLDAELRREVEELLAHDRVAGDAFLSGTARSPSLPAARVHVTIPGFRLQEVLAAGASGLVYRAVQEQPRREVAVKLLRLDALAEDQVARFRREAEILGRLGHPGIAQVFGAGVAEGEAGGLPWIAMELVHGRDLASWITAVRPDTRACVELFRSLCAAVQHAHERGVVHRDLKPSNVLVQEDGRPKVVDFGIARSEEGSACERTRTGLVLGTLAYMAPEQARGEASAVGPASDVYALGVMLFEALTGELPLDVEAVDVLEGVRTVCAVEPRRLRAVAPELPADLETVLIKALDKDPLRRYPGAGALGSDLGNWLADRPVRARRPTIAYQVQKFVRRNRALTAGAAVVSLSLLLALLQARGRLVSERRGNERMSTLTETLSGKYFALSERLGFGDQDRRDAEELIGWLEEQSRLDPGYRPLRAVLAQALNDLGNLHQGSRDPVGAAACYRRALELREGLAAEDPEDRESRSHASRLCAKLGEAALDQGDLAERDRRFAEALARDEALVERFPDDLELREDLGWSLDRVADTAVGRGDEATALRLRLRRLADAKELVRLQPDNWKFVRNLSHVHFFLVGVDPGEDHLGECLRLARREVELRPGARGALTWLAYCEEAARRLAPDLETEHAHAMAAWDIARRLVREDPSTFEHLKLLGNTGLTALGVLERLGRPEAARALLPALREAIEPCRAQRALETYARLLSAELDLWEARQLAAEGGGETTRALEAGAWTVLHEAALSPSTLPGDLNLCRVIIERLCGDPSSDAALTVRRFLEPLLDAGALERARWFADELEKALPPVGAAELARLRREKGF